PRGQADPPIGDWVPIGRPFGICLCCDFTVPVLVPSHDLAVGFAVGLDCGGMTATYIHLSSPFDRVPIRGTPPGVPVAGLYDPGRGRVVYLLTEWYGERETDLTAWALRLDDTLRWERLETNRGPSARVGASVVFDSKGDRIIMFGGRRSNPDPDPNLNEVW